MKITEKELKGILDSIKPESHGICADFEVGLDFYYADLAILPLIGNECMIFKKDGDEILWDGLYCRRDIPYNHEALLECITEFIRTKYVD